MTPILQLLASSMEQCTSPPRVVVIRFEAHIDQFLHILSARWSVSIEGVTERLCNAAFPGSADDLTVDCAYAAAIVLSVMNVSQKLAARRKACAPGRVDHIATLLNMPLSLIVRLLINAWFNVGIHNYRKEQSLEQAKPENPR